MKLVILRKELDELANSVGLQVHKECGGFRLIKGNHNVFPENGICPVATKRECLTFLKGVDWARKLKAREL